MKYLLRVYELEKNLKYKNYKMILYKVERNLKMLLGGGKEERREEEIQTLGGETVAAFISFSYIPFFDPFQPAAHSNSFHTFLTKTTCRFLFTPFNFSNLRVGSSISI